MVTYDETFGALHDNVHNEIAPASRADKSKFRSKMRDCNRQTKREIKMTEKKNFCLSDGSCDAAPNHHMECKYYEKCTHCDEDDECGECSSFCRGNPNACLREDALIEARNGSGVK